MMMMRRILEDRVSATAIAVLAVYLLLLQGLIGGMSRSAMAASAVDPLRALCISTDVAATDSASKSNDPEKRAADCPCASLCRLAGTASPALIPDVHVLELQAPRASNATLPAMELGVVPLLRDFLPQSRAPPSSS